MTSIFLDTFDLFTWKLWTGDIPPVVIASLAWTLDWWGTKRYSAFPDDIFLSLEILSLCCVQAPVLSDWPDCQPSQHHVTRTKTESNDCSGAARPSDWTTVRSGARRCHCSNSFIIPVSQSVSQLSSLVNNFLCGSRNYLWFCFNGRSISFWHSFVVFFRAKLDPTIFHRDLVWEGWEGRLDCRCRRIRPWEHCSHGSETAPAPTD